MKKRFVAMLMVAALMAASLVGCSGSSSSSDDSDSETAETEEDEEDTEDDGDGEASFTIGMRFPVTLDSMQEQALANVTELVEAAGGELLVENAALTTEGNIEAYEKLIAAGVDGLVVIPAADSVLPRIKEMCEEAEIPWVIYYRSILDEDIKAEIEASPYYLGNTYEDEYAAGYNLVSLMGEAGCQNIVLFSTALGDTTGEQREAGMEDACEEYGITVINEFRAVSQASDAAESIESVLTTHPEVDGIFISAGTLTSGILPALTSLLDEYGRTDIKITIIDFPDGLEDGFESGYVVGAVGGHNVTDPLFAVSLLLNEVKGTPLTDEPVSIRINQMLLETAEDVENYFLYCESGISTYTAEEASELLFKWENEDLTIDEFIATAEDYTLETLMERHADLVD